MIIFYRVLTHLIYPFLFILVFFRVFLKKEDPKRYKEKILISHFNVKRNYDQKLIWFHAASIGELKSIVPIIKKLNLDNNLREFLITTSTNFPFSLTILKYGLWLVLYPVITKLNFLELNFLIHLLISL